MSAVLKQQANVALMSALHICMECYWGWGAKERGATVPTPEGKSLNRFASPENGT